MSKNRLPERKILRTGAARGAKIGYAGRHINSSRYQRILALFVVEGAAGRHFLRNKNNIFLH